MRKPMKFKRYEGGGEISGTVDPKEAADKEAGLKASKGDDVGFLQRLRMGNIDDPSSEAYKRFGAGRGRSKAAEEAPTKVEEIRPVPRPLAYPNPIFAAGLEQGKPQKSGDASVAEFYANRKRNPEAIMEADNPRKTAPKPNAPKPSAPKTESKIESAPKAPAYVQRYTEDMMEADNPRSVKAEKAPAEKAKPAAPPPSAPKASSSKVPTSEKAAANRAAAAEKIKGAGSSVADYFSNLESPAKRKAREQKEKAEKGSYASGGSVSSASRRADGIATKGKTRGRMC